MNPTEIKKLIHLTISIAYRRYTVVNMKNTMSLMKNCGVTLIFLIGGPFGSGFMLVARAVKKITTVQIKKVPPIKIQTGWFASRDALLLGSPAAAIDPNTSGAPFPKASNVTPANDSLQLNLSVINSKHGERYASAVSESKYIPMKISNPPMMTKAMYMPVSPNSFEKLQ